MKAHLALLCSSILFSACGKESHQVNESKGGANKPNSTLDLVDSILLEAGDCSVQRPSPLCKKSEFSKKLESTNPNLKESIMVFDQIGLWSFLGKYLNRTAVYSIQPDGSLETVTINKQISKGLQLILEHLGRFDRTEGNKSRIDPELAERANSTLERIFKAFKEDIDEIGVFGHGGIIFGYLAENNPDANMVAVLSDGLFPDEAICNWKGGSVKSFGENLVKNIGIVAVKHNVNYINLSLGYSFENLRKRLVKECKNNPSEVEVVELLSQLQNVLAGISKETGATIFQAANETPQPWLEESETSDCSQMGTDKRIRVGYFFTDGDSPSPFDESYSTVAQGKVPNALAQRMNCTDLLVDFGFSYYFHPTDKPQYFTFDGLYYDLKYIQSTSYATPIALSMIRKNAARLSLTDHGAYQHMTEGGKKKFVHWGSNNFN